MNILSLPLLAAGVAVTIGTQDAARTVTATMPAGDPALTPPGVESAAANRAALSITAEQTARIMADRDQNARNVAAYALAQGNHDRDVKRYEAEQAAAAGKAAAAAAAYQAQLASWRAGADRHRRPTPKAAVAAADAAAKPAPKRVCRFETPTGSNMAVRVCR